jgi:nucleoside-diphosphate-sugar epimerase
MATPVTGGMGFVGANIVKELAHAGHQVVCLDITDS